VTFTLETGLHMSLVRNILCNCQLDLGWCYCTVTEAALACSWYTEQTCS